jgi:DNA primase
VHVPLRPDDDFDSVRGFAREIAGLMVSRFPERLTMEQRKENRASPRLSAPRRRLDAVREGRTP